MRHLHSLSRHPEQHDCNVFRLDYLMNIVQVLTPLYSIKMRYQLPYRFNYILEYNKPDNKAPTYCPELCKMWAKAVTLLTYSASAYMTQSSVHVTYHLKYLVIFSGQCETICLIVSLLKSKLQEYKMRYK